jgi:hypothetical protein
MYMMNSKKQIIFAFGNEDIKFINKQMILNLLKTKDDAICSLLKLIHCNEEKSCNHNIYIDDLNSDSALIYNGIKYIEVGKNELFKQIMFVKSKIMHDMIKTYSLSINDYPEYKNIYLNTLKQQYLEVRTGMLNDNKYFNEHELQQYEKIRQKNFEKFKVNEDSKSVILSSDSSDSDEKIIEPHKKKNNSNSHKSRKKKESNTNSNSDSSSESDSNNEHESQKKKSNSSKLNNKSHKKKGSSSDNDQTINLKLTVKSKKK